MGGCLPALLGTVPALLYQDSVLLPATLSQGLLQYTRPSPGPLLVLLALSAPTGARLHWGLARASRALRPHWGPLCPTQSSLDWGSGGLSLTWPPDPPLRAYAPLGLLARVILDKDPRHPGRVRHLPSVVSIGPHRRYVTYHGQLKLCSRCGLAGELAALCSLTVCYRCSSMGHQAKACKQEMKCTVCGGEGHLQHRCEASASPQIHLKILLKY
uniref:CCHC-type domain-containing protein n=1 Tax=Crocodylus porosus TaxID=8502 RepID=A0A7M4E889_CROPO